MPWNDPALGRALLTLTAGMIVCHSRLKQPHIYEPVVIWTSSPNQNALNKDGWTNVYANSTRLGLAR